MKRRFASLLCIIVLGPILPLYFLRTLAQGIVDGLDWMTEGRSWCRPFLAGCEAIERRFGVDADTKYREWRERMGFEITTKKGEL
jgi:hypothetical protein